MVDLSRHENAYVRPSPTNGSLGTAATNHLLFRSWTWFGLFVFVTRRCGAKYNGGHHLVWRLLFLSTISCLCCCLFISKKKTNFVLPAAGYNVVLVETVGVGQSETMVADMVDMFVLLVPPAGGDELQVRFRCPRFCVVCKLKCLSSKKRVLNVALWKWPIWSSSPKPTVLPFFFFFLVGYGIPFCLIRSLVQTGDLVNAARAAQLEYTSALKFMPPKTSFWRPKVVIEDEFLEFLFFCWCYCHCCCYCRCVLTTLTNDQVISISALQKQGIAAAWTEMTDFNRLLVVCFFFFAFFKNIVRCLIFYFFFHFLGGVIAPGIRHAAALARRATQDVDVAPSPWATQLDVRLLFFFFWPLSQTHQKKKYIINQIQCFYFYCTYLIK